MYSNNNLSVHVLLVHITTSLPPTHSLKTSRFMEGIYTEGCFSKVQRLINSNLYVALGVGIGLLVFQIFCVLLASGLAVDVHREKKLAKAFKKQEKAEREAQGITTKL